ncbi:MAG: hypothetical protein GF353_13135 [Candidatus Lokiarchaeota archaeon]|nr:hypothetical protein [Candidatus Lokiarchaeota archaeon]
MDIKNITQKYRKIRAIKVSDLNLNSIKKIAFAFAIWINKDEILIARDNTPQGEYYRKPIIEGLIRGGCKIVDLEISPLPILIYAINKLNIAGAIYLSGINDEEREYSVNLLTKNILISEAEFGEIMRLYYHRNLGIDEDLDNNKEVNKIRKLNLIENYINEIFDQIEISEVRRKNELRVIVDTGAGAGNLTLPKILNGLGCRILEVNNTLDHNMNFPRGSALNKENLKHLILTFWKGNFDIGFAQNRCGFNTVVLGDDFKLYDEDTMFAFVVDYYLKQKKKTKRNFVIVTNITSSLIFEELAKKYNVQVLRLYTGAKQFKKELNKYIDKNRDYIIFKTEGPIGNALFPKFYQFNDSYFLIAKIIEILVKSGKRFSKLVSKLPKYYSFEKKVFFSNKNIDHIMDKIKEELTSEGEEVILYGKTIRFGDNEDWFVVIHPSKKDESITVISDAKRESLARIYCQTTAELVKMILSQI